MPILRMFKRRQLLQLGGVGAIGLLGGGVATAEIINVRNFPLQPANEPRIPSDGPYLNLGTFNQQFLAKSADVKQVWDFASIEQIQSDGFIPIKNAMNAFQFVYRKSLYPVICLRGNAVIYALEDATWVKYSLSTVYGQQTGEITAHNPLYHRFTNDNGTLSPNDSNSLFQDSSLQVLLQRGSDVVVCHDALNGLATQIAGQRELSVQTIFKELAAHLVPGTQQTPSGSSFIAVAQHLGFTYAKQ